MKLIGILQSCMDTRKLIIHKPSLAVVRIAGIAINFYISD